MKLSPYVLPVALCIVLALAAPAAAYWPASGLHVNNLGNPSAMVGDGAGGVFLNWAATRVQRISPDGDLLLPVNGPYFTGVSESAPAFSDDAGGIYIAVRQTTTIALVRIGPMGQVLWSTNVCTTTNAKSNLVACADGAAGALMVWSEDRGDPANAVSGYGQRVDADGNPLWALDGLRVRWNSEYVTGPGPGGYTSPLDIYPLSIAPGTPGGEVGGAVLLTREEGVNGPSFFQCWMLPTGAPGAVKYSLYHPTMVIPDGDGGVYAWTGGLPPSGLSIERISTTAPNWNQTLTHGWHIEQNAVACAGADGVLMAWVDDRDGAGTNNIYIQKWAPNGVRAWTYYGVPVCTANGSQTQPDIAGDFNGGAQVAWSDGRNGLADIYTTHVSSEGVVIQPDGDQLSSDGGSEVSPRVYTDPDNYAIVSWKGLYGVFAQRVNMTPVAVAISDFRASIRDGDVVLNATLRSGLGVDFVKIYRAVDQESFVLLDEAIPDGEQFEYVDNGVAAATAYRYQLLVGDADGEFLSLIAGVTTPGIEFALRQNQPNPFNPETTIRFVLPEAGQATLSVYAPTGERVRSLFDGVAGPGPHDVRWDGTDDAGIPVASGIYFYRLRAGRSSATRKMVLLK